LDLIGSYPNQKNDFEQKTGVFTNTNS